MPTKKPVIQAVISEKTFEKIKVICEREDRSTSYIGGKAIEYYVKAYEEENGKIDIEQ